MTIMYKLIRNPISLVSSVQRISDNASIPFDPANTDYQQFKKDIMDGGELQDADGVVMANAQEFIRSLP